jgi:GNAT superfamily N-acetyltransferase
MSQLTSLARSGAPSATRLGDAIVRVHLSGPWQLREATPEQLSVLGACWAVPVDDLADRERAWVQSRGAGDAPGPRVVELATRTLTVLPPAGEISRRWAPRMVGLRGLRALPARAATLPEGLSILTQRDAGAVTALHARTRPDELSAAAPDVDGSELAVGVRDGGRLLGVAAMVTTPVGPPEVSVLVDAEHRRRGLALVLETALIGAAGGRQHRWLQHRTVLADVASQALAARCGFLLVSIEHLVRAIN